MAKPTKHGDKWRVRWLDEHGKRQSAVFDDYKIAQTEVRRQQVEVEQIKRGTRNASPRGTAARSPLPCPSGSCSAPVVNPVEGAVVAECAPLVVVVAVRAVPRVVAARRKGSSALDLDSVRHLGPFCWRHSPARPATSARSRLVSRCDASLSMQRICPVARGTVLAEPRAAAARAVSAGNASQFVEPSRAAAHARSPRRSAGHDRSARRVEAAHGTARR